MYTRPTNGNSAVVRLMIVQDNLSNNIESLDRRIEEYRTEMLSLMREREAKIEEQLEVCEAIDRLVDGTAVFMAEAPAEPTFTPVAPAEMQYAILPFHLEEEDGEGPSLEDVVRFLLASGFPNGGR
ncbi:hypothetical protein vBKpnAMK6_00043 [Klebsiella phage vB_Kpn_AM_K6]